MNALQISVWFQRYREQRGFVMIEVLVAILVLAFGMLGLLSLMLNSMKVSSSANYRTIAAEEVFQMADTLRANVTVLASFGSPSLACAESPSCYQSPASGGGCTPAQIVCNEVAEWQTRIQAALPNGVANVCRAASSASGSLPPNTDNGAWKCPTASGTGPFVVRICWDESRVGSGAVSGAQANAGVLTCVYSQL